MSFNLIPRNKSAGEHNIGAFSWSFMLDAGLGLVLGTGPGFKPAEFIYVTRPDNKCVQYNDGARVTAEESKDLAKVARWIARVQEARIKQWNTIPEAERTRIEQESKRMLDQMMMEIYKLPWHPDAVQKFVAFADWAEKSGGFKIY